MTPHPVTQDINSKFFHFGLYRLANKYHVIFKVILFFLFGSILVSGVFTFSDSEYFSSVGKTLCMRSAFIFIGIIILISIDRAIQLIQLNQIKKRHMVETKSSMKMRIAESKYPWAIL